MALTSASFLRPVVFFANGIGDHLVTLPAIRALSTLFSGRISLVCLADARELFFGDVEFQNVWRIPFLGGADHTRRLFEAPRLFDSFLHRQPGAQSFDVDALRDTIGSCDLFMVLTEWDSVDIAALRDVLAPRISIGPFAGYTHQLTREPVHAIDRPFSCPRLFEPEIDPASYSTPPLMGAPGSILAKQLRRAMGPDQHLLTVHTDTKARKMWSARKFLETIEGFLDCRPDFIAVIVGQRHGMCLPESKHANRIFDFCRIPLGLTFSVVQNSSLFLGIDSCMLHVSDLARVPGVGLFGPTSPKVWGFRFARHVHLMGVDGDLDSSSVVNALLSMSPPS